MKTSEFESVFQPISKEELRLRLSEKMKKVYEGISEDERSRFVDFLPCRTCIRHNKLDECIECQSVLLRSAFYKNML